MNFSEINSLSLSLSLALSSLIGSYPEKNSQGEREGKYLKNSL
jgi:hypothetical protein